MSGLKAQTLSLDKKKMFQEFGQLSVKGLSPYDVLRWRDKQKPVSILLVGYLNKYGCNCTWALCSVVSAARPCTVHTTPRSFAVWSLRSAPLQCGLRTQALGSVVSEARPFAVHTTPRPCAVWSLHLGPLVWSPHPGQ